MSLIAELKRRSVFKVAAAYVVVAWLAAQAAGLVFPTFGAPDWALRVFIFVLMIGLPVALVLAWAFELTPEGVKVDVHGVGSKRMFAIAAGLAALALGWYLFGAPAVRDAGVAERSIAVLPFVNMSGDADNEYFSDGISEEILNVLAQTPGLKVAARTSSFSYKGKDRGIPDIARELDVRMVLEGSVRKQGGKVRITAQLIDATQGFHVWSKTYDRDLEDIFAIQDEIAREIGRQLQVKLGGGDGSAADDISGTHDLAAYDLYLQGLALFQKRGTDNVVAADGRFREAVARDPAFAKAWGGIALVNTALSSWKKVDLAEQERIRSDAALRALALDPELPEGWLVLATIETDRLNFATGEALMQRTLALAPSHATAWQWHGEQLASQGEFERAIEATRRAVELDPKSSIARLAATSVLAGAGRLDEAERMAQSIVENDATFMRAYHVLTWVRLAKQDYAGAREPYLALHATRTPASQAAADRVMDAFEGKLPEAEFQTLVENVARLADQSAELPDDPILGARVRFLLYRRAGRVDLIAPVLAMQAKRLPESARTMFQEFTDPAIRCRPDVQAVAHSMGIEDRRFAELCGEARGTQAPRP